MSRFTSARGLAAILVTVLIGLVGFLWMMGDSDFRTSAPLSGPPGLSASRTARQASP
jgi:hypothetical protein